MKKVKKVLKTNDQFKKDVIEKFGDKFNLDKVNYTLLDNSPKDDAEQIIAEIINTKDKNNLFIMR